MLTQITSTHFRRYSNYIYFAIGPETEHFVIIIFSARFLRSCEIDCFSFDLRSSACLRHFVRLYYVFVFDNYFFNLPHKVLTGLKNDTHTKWLKREPGLFLIKLENA